MQCGYCHQAELVLVPADEPWSPEHYSCPKCDSTFPADITQGAMDVATLTEGERSLIAQAALWRRSADANAKAAQELKCQLLEAQQRLDAARDEIKRLQAQLVAADVRCQELEDELHLRTLVV